MMDKIAQYFGEDIRSLDKRVSSYDYLENLITRSHDEWSRPPNTEQIVRALLGELNRFSTQEFAFLLCHTGYIPESYLPDSSQETLYSKLVEALVQEWAIRIGFDKSQMQTQKASKEDITIKDSKSVIVCDAKSFRLGRSQAAPNVKDVLKHADISKWLSHYPSLERLGGLVAFPSQHDWKKGSDFYQYTTDRTLPTISLYYEHMAFFLLIGTGKERLIEAYRDYSKLFPEKITKSKNNRKHYYDTIEKYLFQDINNEWLDYRAVADTVISERVFHCAHTLDQHISAIKSRIESKYSKETDIEQLRRKAIEADYLRATEDLHKQKERIHKFRTSADKYHEK